MVMKYIKKRIYLVKISFTHYSTKYLSKTHSMQAVYLYRHILQPTECYASIKIHVEILTPKEVVLEEGAFGGG
jgi:hypothetical protein